MVEPETGDEVHERWEAFRRQLVEFADRSDLTHPPWFDTYGKTMDEVLSQVRGALEEQGYWEGYCESTFGGGPLAQIELIQRDGVQTYLAGGCKWLMRQEYRTLERALDMAVLFARLGWDIEVALSWGDHDIVRHPERRKDGSWKGSSPWS